MTREIPFAKDISLLSSNNDYILTPYSSILWGLMVGGIFGCFFFFHLYTIKKV